MSAEIIDLPRREPVRNPGNGARGALIEIGVDLPNTTEEDAGRWADWLVAELWERGFKIIPVGG